MADSGAAEGGKDYSTTARFRVPVQQLGFHDLAMDCVVEPGDFKVWIGPNAAEGLEGEFKVLGA